MDHVQLEPISTFYNFWLVLAFGLSMKFCPIAMHITTLANTELNDAIGAANLFDQKFSAINIFVFCSCQEI